MTAEQVEIFRQGNDIVLRERPASAAAIFDALVGMPTDFIADGRSDSAPQERGSF
ncbi:antitoxin [Variovorax sp. DT-64]